METYKLFMHCFKTEQEECWYATLFWLSIPPSAASLLIQLKIIIWSADASAGWYRSTLEGLLFQGLSSLLPESEHSGNHASKLLVAPSLPPPSVPHSRQKYQHPPQAQQPVGLPIEKDRIHLQVAHPMVEDLVLLQCRERTASGCTSNLQ